MKKILITLSCVCLVYLLLNMFITTFMTIASVIYAILGVIDDIRLLELFKTLWIKYYYDGKLFDTNIIMWRFHIVGAIVTNLMVLMLSFDWDLNDYDDWN